jgi:hypothetical protein
MLSAKISKVYYKKECPRLCDFDETKQSENSTKSAFLQKTICRAETISFDIKSCKMFERILPK